MSDPSIERAAHPAQQERLRMVQAERQRREKTAGAVVPDPARLHGTGNEPAPRPAGDALKGILGGLLRPAPRRP